TSTRTSSSRRGGAMRRLRRASRRSTMSVSAMNEVAIRGQMGQPASRTMASKKPLLFDEGENVRARPGLGKSGRRRYPQNLWIIVWVTWLDPTRDAFSGRMPGFCSAREIVKNSMKSISYELISSVVTKKILDMYSLRGCGKVLARKA